MNCPNCKTPTLISLSPVSWFCSRCGKFHTEFRMDGIFNDDLKAPDPTDVVTENVEKDIAPTIGEDKEPMASVNRKECRKTG